jgi:2'-5' RNA ligase
MGKNLKKYFIGIVPKGEAGEMAHHIKLALKEKFGIKYALKSPPHITLKMPFLFNENKESILKEKLHRFFEAEQSFEIGLKGFKTFGSRVIYIVVKSPPELMQLQSTLAQFAKSRLLLPLELSDTNYNPHMTVAFKDLKKAEFGQYLEFVKKYKVDFQVETSEVSLLKKMDYQWEICENFTLLKGD